LFFGAGIKERRVLLLPTNGFEMKCLLGWSSSSESFKTTGAKIRFGPE